jgi:hypothetical protein
VTYAALGASQSRDKPRGMQNTRSIQQFVSLLVLVSVKPNLEKPVSQEDCLAEVLGL